MAIVRTALIKPASRAFCKSRGSGSKRGTTRARGATRPARAAALALALLLTVGGAAAGAGVYETWTAENFTLGPRESFQMLVTYDQIQVRNWKLVVDGGDMNCDLHVKRVKDGSLLYQRSDERHHEVLIPWGEGEAVSIAVTNRDRAGSFVVSLLGPPRDQVHASYSYHVNRALDLFAAGQRLAAEAECGEALRENPQDSVAKVLLAGFLRDRDYYDRAATLVDEALATELPGTMREVAEGLRRDLVRLRAPLPLPVQRGVVEIEDLLVAGKGAAALAASERLLEGDLELDSASQGRLQLLRGRALAQLDRNFEALDAYTTALQLSRDKDAQAVVSFYMGRLFLKMDNLPQAEGAFTLALQNGLPSGLDVRAREHLQLIKDRRRSER